MDLKAQIKNLPLTSGVYLMKDKDGRVIYIGKAVSLRKRVQSYFRKKPVGVEGYALKLEKLVSDILSIDHIPTSSEAEALILEASLVKQHKPKFNSDLLDDKSYPLIQITNEEFPRVSIERPRVRNPKYTYYGPYVSAGLIREALNIIRRIFFFRTCQPFPNKECLDYHIGLCSAPCIGKISKEDYAKNIRNVRWILEGKKDELYQKMTEEMQQLSKEKKYEEAVKMRDQLRALGALYSGTQDVNYFKEAEQLQRALDLPRLPERIETLDISNIMGQYAVG
ncbi:MAG: GIY-YIG nuclease family protein, partial [Sedimentisphaerales bacterium]|nr:GIY-YIG nuclease family protein [Sedimentisphaerales bacterium]